jgi:carbon storage regulator CsrA
MLVLNRRKNQRVLFPNVGISVEVIKVGGRTVRLGIEAPRDVRVVRDELAYRELPADAAAEPPLPTDHEPARRPRHAATRAIHLARMQLQQGHTQQAERSLQLALDCLARLPESADHGNEEPVAHDLAVREHRRSYRKSKRRYGAAADRSTDKAAYLPVLATICSSNFAT